MLKANDPSLKSWVEVEKDSDFPIQNLPFGIFKTSYLSPVAGVAIGNFVLDLVYLHDHGLLDGCGLPDGIFNQEFLNNFIALGRAKGTLVRNRISELLRHDNETLKGNVALREISLIPSSEVQMLMPIKVPNYTDFYSSLEHATNVGAIYRDPKNPLLPNWRHLPVGYHGRASSITVSGTPVRRPSGQIKPANAESPIFGPTQKLDFELELAFITCADTSLGVPVPVERCEDFIFGVVLFNDWSARDIQQWEYVPLGPFLGKSFASTISPWIVTLDALEPFFVNGPRQEPAVLPYLKLEGKHHLDIELEVAIRAGGSKETLACRSNARHLYWSMSQQLAHQTCNGCNIQVGDLYASGTISGPSEGSYGSMLEITKNGQAPMVMADGSLRKFISDGDVVILRGHATRDGVRVGFGECSASVLSAGGS